MTDDLKTLIEEALHAYLPGIGVKPHPVGSDPSLAEADHFLATPAGQRIAVRAASNPYGGGMVLLQERDEARAERDAARADAERLAKALWYLHAASPAHGPECSHPDCTFRAALALHDEQEPKHDMGAIADGIMERHADTFPPLREQGYVCTVCGRAIVTEGSGNSPGDHDPAYHVAQAYHYRRPDDLCASCSQLWPCPTIEEYTLP